MNSKKRIALIGYHPADYYAGLAKALEEVGFEVFWVHGTRGAVNRQKSRLTTPPANILDTTEDFRADLNNADGCRRELSELERPGCPRINDIVLMDRILRNKDYKFSLCYLHHLQRVLSKFFSTNAIALVSSGRDTALQLMSMLVCRRLGIPWVAPTRMRIPLDMYMFATEHETASVVDVRIVTNEDRAWAVEFLRSFNARPAKPALKVATRNFSDVVRMLPRHAQLFFSLLRLSLVDRWNDYSRYTIPRIVRMYLQRRFNMVTFKLFRPCSPVGDRPFCLYALHTQPESSIDVAGSYFSDQIALVTFIARSLPASHELYVKVHPTDVDGKPLSFYRKIARLPGVRLINYDADSRDLVKRASIVFTLTGTIGYEAALMGQTVVTFAKNYFNDMPTVYYCDSPPQLPALIDSILESKHNDNENERLVAFLAHLRARSFEGEFNRMYLPTQDQLSTEDLKALQVAYNTVFEVVARPSGRSGTVSAV